MAASFASLQIRGLPPSEEDRLPTGATVIRHDGDWITLVREDYEIGRIDRDGRALSKKITAPVLAVGCFDEDIVTLSLFRDGKRVDRHVSDTAYGLTRHMGKPAVFAGELALSPAQGAVLPWVLRRENLYEKIDLLEKLLGIPLWIDHRMVALSGEGEYKDKGDLAFVEAAMREQKAAARVRNRTTARLIMEFPGLSNNCSEGLLLIHPPDTEGQYDDRYAWPYYILPSGEPAPCRDHGIEPIEFINTILSAGDLTAVFENSTGIRDPRPKDRLTFFTRDGHFLRRNEFARGAYPCALLPDGSSLIITYAYNNYRQTVFLMDAHGEKKWALETDWIQSAPAVHNGSIYYQQSRNRQCEIIKLSLEGRIEARRPLPLRGSIGRFFFFDGDKLYYVQDTGQPGHSRLCRLTDDTLESDEEIGLPGFPSMLCTKMDIDHHTLYADILDQNTLVIDTRTLAIRKAAQNFYPFFIDVSGNVASVPSSSTLELYDRDIQILSRHRLKGSIFGVYPNDRGNLCVVTGTGHSVDWKRNSPQIIRVYELEPR